MASVNNAGISLESVDTIVQLRARIQRWKQAGDTIALVPTMGNLHDGHLALVKAATESSRRTVVSIFVNPMQFGVNEDFDTYPRTLTDDIRKLSHYPVDLVFSPTIGEVYPQGTGETAQVIVPGLSDILEGEHRPVALQPIQSITYHVRSALQGPVVGARPRNPA